MKSKWKMSKCIILLTLLSIFSFSKNANVNLRNSKIDKKEAGSGDIMNIKNMTPSNNQNLSFPPPPRSVNVVETKQPEHKNLELIISNIPKSLDGKIIPSSSQVSLSQSNRNNFRTEIETQSQAKINYENNKLLTEKMKYKNVKIIDPHSVPNRSPEYIQKHENTEMKTAILINKEKDRNSEYSIGLTERPNYLSSVIHPHATSVLTPHNLYSRDANTPTYDLENIKKRHYFELMAKGGSSNSGSESNSNLMNFGGDNMMDGAVTSVNIVNSMPYINIHQHPQSLPINMSHNPNTFPNAGEIISNLRQQNLNGNRNINSMMPLNYADQKQIMGPHLNPNVLPVPTHINLPNISPMGISIPPNTVNGNFNSGAMLPPLAGHFLNPPITTILNNSNQLNIPNLPNISNHSNQLNLPDEQHFNMKVSYKGQVIHGNSVKIPDLNQIEKKIQSLDKLSEQELNEGKSI